DFGLYHLGNRADLEIVIAGVPDFSVDHLVRRFEQFEVKIGHVVDMDVRPQLVAAEHRDATIIDGVIGEDIDGEVEAKPRRISAYRRRPQGDADEARLALL